MGSALAIDEEYWEMSEESGPLIDLRTPMAMGERIAIIETKLASLKEDSVVIRSSLHSTHGEMQKFVAAELDCGKSLGMLVQQTMHLPALIEVMREFTDLRPKLLGLIQKDQERMGVWRVVAIIGSTLVGLGVMIAAAAAVIELFLHK